MALFGLDSFASGAQQESCTTFSPTFQTGALWQLTAAEGASVRGLERAEAESCWAVRSLDICVNWATSAETRKSLGDLWQFQTPPQDILRMSKPMQDKCPSKIPSSWGRSYVGLFARKQAFARPIRIEDITGPWIDVTPLGGNGNGW